MIDVVSEASLISTGAPHPVKRMWIGLNGVKTDRLIWEEEEDNNNHHKQTPSMSSEISQKFLEFATKKDFISLVPTIIVPSTLFCVFMVPSLHLRGARAFLPKIYKYIFTEKTT